MRVNLYVTIIDGEDTKCARWLNKKGGCEGPKVKARESITRESKRVSGNITFKLNWKKAQTVIGVSCEYGFYQLFAFNWLYLFCNWNKVSQLNKKTGSFFQNPIFLFKQIFPKLSLFIYLSVSLHMCLCLYVLCLFWNWKRPDWKMDQYFIPFHSTIYTLFVVSVSVFRSFVHFPPPCSFIRILYSSNILIALQSSPLEFIPNSMRIFCVCIHVTFANSSFYYLFKCWYIYIYIHTWNDKQMEKVVSRIELDSIRFSINFIHLYGWFFSLYLSVYMWVGLFYIDSFDCDFVYCDDDCIYGFFLSWSSSPFHVTRPELVIIITHSS